MKVKLFSFGVVILVLMIAGAVFLLQSSIQAGKKQQTKPVIKTMKVKAASNDLTVAPQFSKGEVRVESATLSKDGFVVAREVIGNKLGQVIEISKPLNAGMHKNIVIPLGDADVSKSELIVMIYEDYGNDGVFNDFDTPALNEEGFMTARYVKTGKPLPTSITEGESTAMNMQGMKSMATVRYTGRGFVPDKIEVEAGSMVSFINESSTVMWVASTPHPQHTDLPTFDQFRPYKPGSTYRYIFDKKGTWGFHDHINPSRGGMVVVK